MKKILRRLLLLTLWMVLCLVPLTANAEGENPIELTQDNYKSYLKDSGKYDKFYLPSGSYILMGDITLDDTLLIGFDQQYYDNDFTGLAVTLDLNGYVLRQGNVQELDPVIQVYQGSTLTIQDSRPEVRLAIPTARQERTAMAFMSGSGTKTETASMLTAA